MIKKIKPIKIIVAVVTALVFCIALAVPCFADSPIDGTDYVINTITFTDGDTAYAWFAQNSESVVKVTAGVGLLPESASFNTFFAFFDDSGAFDGIVGSLFMLTDVVDLNNGSAEIQTQSFMFELNADSLRFTPSFIDVNFVNNLTPSVDHFALAEVSNDNWADTLGGVYMTVEYTTEYVSNEDATRSGMFGQLYNILRDAIFGKDVSLDDSQDFVLTQISTWMTYIVILLPILVVGLILFRMFCR